MAARARKRFGQHFLHDPRVIQRIVDAIGPRPGDRIVEIGGGRGALTRPLLERVERLDVVEVDRDLAEALARELGARHPAGAPERPDASAPAQHAVAGRAVVHAADALAFDFASLAPEEPGRGLRVVGNLPYNISTPLLFRLLEFRPRIQDIHVMLQKEIVERMTAAPGGKTYGRLTVMLSAWTDVEACFDIGPGAFNPPPKVWSTFVRIRPRTQPRFVVEDERRFAQLVAHLFSMRRKTLARALKGRVTAEEIAALGIDPRARPETLPASDFEKLSVAAGRQPAASR